jgi:hypothetical protein
VTDTDRPDTEGTAAGTPATATSNTTDTRPVGAGDGTVDRPTDTGALRSRGTGAIKTDRGEASPADTRGQEPAVTPNGADDAPDTRDDRHSLDPGRTQDVGRTPDTGHAPDAAQNADAAEPADAGAATDVAAAAPAIPPQYGVGPFSVREATLGIVWAFAFIISFFALVADRSVWTNGIEWIITIGLPTVAVFLIALRRLSPTGIRRVGSLGIDQFASVAFAVSAALWLQYVWQTVAIAMSGGGWVRSWVMWVETVLMLGGVVLTVVAKWLPVLGDDFQYRAEIVAQPSARPIRPVAPRPVTPRPERVTEVATLDELIPITETVPAAEPVAEAEPVRSDAETVAVPVAASQAFWALVPVERDVVDEHGVPLFRIGPTAWALVIEDRGSTFVVRNDDGRVGYLRDVSGVTRG